MSKTDLSPSVYTRYHCVARDELERLDVAPGDPTAWEDLDGTTGAHRNRDVDRRPCLLAAKNEGEGVVTFLATVPKSP